MSAMSRMRIPWTHCGYANARIPIRLDLVNLEVPNFALLAATEKIPDIGVLLLTDTLIIWRVLRPSRAGLGAPFSLRILHAKTVKPIITMHLNIFQTQ